MTAQQEPEHCGHKGPVFEEQKTPRGYCDNTFLGKKCIHSSSEYYCIEDGNDCDSGYDYYCNHPSVGRKITPAHHGEVPDWCPCKHDTRSRHAPTHGDCHYCAKCIESERAEAAAQAREKLFEAIRAERDPHLDYVDWDSIEAAYMRTEGGEPR